MNKTIINIVGANVMLIALADSLLKALIAYILLLAVTRLMGRKAISQMTSIDFAIAITIGSITANIALGAKFTTASAVAVLLAFYLFGVVTAYLHIKSFRFRKIVNSEPVTTIENGKIIEQNMKKIRLSIDNLMSMLRENNVFNVADVEFAIMESNGRLSVELKSQNQPVTPADLNIPTGYKGLTRDLIIDGKIMHENLQAVKLDEKWLLKQLNDRNIKNTEDVFFAGLDTSGNLYISERMNRTEQEGEYGIE